MGESKVERSVVVSLRPRTSKFVTTTSESDQQGHVSLYESQNMQDFGASHYFFYKNRVGNINFNFSLWKDKMRD